MNSARYIICGAEQCEGRREEVRYARALSSAGGYIINASQTGISELEQLQFICVMCLRTVVTGSADTLTNRPVTKRVGV